MKQTYATPLHITISHFQPLDFFLLPLFMPHPLLPLNFDEDWRLTSLGQQRGSHRWACHPCQSCRSRTPQSSSWTAPPASAASPDILPCPPTIIITTNKHPHHTPQENYLLEDTFLKRPSYSVYRVENLWRHSFQLSWYLQPKHISFLVVGFEKFARVNGINDLPRVLQLDPLAHTIPGTKESENSACQKR